MPQEKEFENAILKNTLCASFYGMYSHSYSNEHLKHPSKVRMDKRQHTQLHIAVISDLICSLRVEGKETKQFSDVIVDHDEGSES